MALGLSINVCSVIAQVAYATQVAVATHDTQVAYATQVARETR